MGFSKAEGEYRISDVELLGRRLCTMGHFVWNQEIFKYVLVLGESQKMKQLPDSPGSPVSQTEGRAPGIMGEGAQSWTRACICHTPFWEHVMLSCTLLIPQYGEQKK